MPSNFYIRALKISAVFIVYINCEVEKRSVYDDDRLEDVLRVAEVAAGYLDEHPRLAEEKAKMDLKYEEDYEKYLREGLEYRMKEYEEYSSIPSMSEDERNRILEDAKKDPFYQFISPHDFDSYESEDAFVTYKGSKHKLEYLD